MAVLEGRDPRTGDDLGQRHAAQKNVAYDITFSLPKSVSLLYALGDPDVNHAVLRALDVGATAIHDYLQRHAAWGRVYNGVTDQVDRIRADLVTASFVHRTARPVTRDGTTTVDPQLHTHLVIAARVHRADGTWGAVYNEPLYTHAAAAGAVGQAATRDALVRELGVRVHTHPNGTFELDGFSEDQLAEFSQRHRQVVEAAATAGASSMYGQKVAVLDSRESRREIDPGTDLFAEQLAVLADAILAEPSAVVPMVPSQRPSESPMSAMHRRERGMKLHYSTAEVIALEARMLLSADARNAGPRAPPCSIQLSSTGSPP